MYKFKVTNDYFPVIESWLFKNSKGAVWSSKPEYQVVEHASRVVNLIEIEDKSFADRFKLIWSNYLK